MKKELRIPSSSGFCRDCFRKRPMSSSRCGFCSDEPERMKIYTDKQEYFPLLKEVKKLFPINDNTILTYGDTIYYDYDLPYHLIAHEVTHCLQQSEIEKEWWEKYLKDPEFRLSQEVEAYHNQYESVKNIDLLKAEKILNEIARHLSSELYGNIISFDKAKELIKNYEK